MMIRDLSLGTMGIRHWSLGTMLIIDWLLETLINGDLSWRIILSHYTDIINVSSKGCLICCSAFFKTVHKGSKKSSIQVTDHSFGRILSHLGKQWFDIEFALWILNINTILGKPLHHQTPGLPHLNFAVPLSASISDQKNSNWTRNLVCAQLNEYYAGLNINKIALASSWK